MKTRSIPLRRKVKGRKPLPVMDGAGRISGSIPMRKSPLEAVLTPLPKGIYLSEEDKRLLLNRLSRIEGQIRAIKKRITEGECADDLIIQISAVRGAMTKFAVKVLREHLVSCANTCMMRNGRPKEVYERTVRALSVILRQS